MQVQEEEEDEDEEEEEEEEEVLVCRLAEVGGKPFYAILLRGKGLNVYPKKESPLGIRECAIMGAKSLWKELR